MEELLKLLFKNAFRHKLRTGLTILGITIAILAFGLLRTVVHAWYAGVEASSATRLVTRNSISLVFFLPLSYKEKIRQVPGVSIVSYADWFGGVYINEKNFFPNFAIDAKSYFDLYPEFVVPEEQKKAFVLDRKGCIAGRKVAERFGWKLGDTIVLKGTIYPGMWQCVLRGIYHGARENTDETQFFLQYDYVNESLKKTTPRRADMVGFYLVGVKNPDQAAEVAVAIDNQFRNSLAETRTETEKAFQLSFVAMSQAIITVIQAVSFIVIFIIMAVMANTMAMTARERIGEYAIMKTLGFGGRSVAALVFGESLIIALIGCVIGIALTFPAAKWFGHEMANYIPIFQVETKTLYLDVVVAIFVGIIAAIFPAWRAVTVKIADGLRRIG